MPIDLSQPFDDTGLPGPAEKAFLQNLQANILKGHGREHVALLFLAIDNAAQARTFLAGYPVSDAHTQLDEARRHKRLKRSGGAVRLVFLSHAGLSQFGHGGAFTGFGRYAAGMAADTAVLDAGSTAGWQPALQQPLHVMLLLGFHDAEGLARLVSVQLQQLEAGSGLRVLFIQEGRAYKNADGEGIEHFGYVDGRSQPLMLTSQIAAEPHTVFKAAAPLGQFIVPDPLAADEADRFGSFFVFRKLEQNVAGFKQAEAGLAGHMGLTGNDAERAGAQVVGRFEDGTPLVLSSAEQGVPVRNDFDYSSDTAGGKCPFHAHIRKTHPRGASPGGAAFDHAVQMARRGITYGTRLQDPDTTELIDRPNDGVGLLFMSYQASIEKQFHFMQVSWANNEDFPHTGVGIDPVIGQGGGLPQQWPPRYGSATPTVPSHFGGFVSLKGGEYFYAPSVAGLKRL